MSAYFEDDEDDQQNTPKALRDAYEKAKEQNKELQSKLAKLEGQVRVQSVKEILTDLGLKSKVANLLPKDIEPTKEAVEAWAKDFEDVFGGNLRSEVKADANEAAPESADVPAQPPVDPELVKAFSRLQAPEAQSGVTTPDMEQQQIAWLQAANAASGGSSEKFFAILRGETQLPTT